MNAPQRQVMHAVYNTAEYQANEEGGVKPNSIYRWKEQAHAFVDRLNKMGCKFEVREEIWMRVDETKGD